MVPRALRASRDVIALAVGMAGAGSCALVYDFPYGEGDGGAGTGSTAQGSATGTTTASSTASSVSGTGGATTTGVGGTGGGDASSGGSSGSGSGGDPGSGGGGNGGSDVGSGGATIASTSTGALACDEAEDCPEITSECCEKACDSDGTCGADRFVAGTACGVGQVCAGDGACVRCVIDGDCPLPASSCRARQCVAGSCHELSLGVGTPCSDGQAVGQCDAVDNCVECVNNAPCTETEVCVASACLPDSCANGVLDADEAAVDCGGACAPCPNGTPCSAPIDCRGNCPQTNVCADCTANAQCSLGWLVWRICGRMA